MRFTKMHGLGNDYVYVNCFEEQVENPAALARVISDRHTGVGGDGLVLICPSDVADVRMRMFNPDGSEAEMCGNALRCVAKYAYERGLVQSGGIFSVPGQVPCPASIHVETGNGILKVGLITNANDEVDLVCVNMGQPVLVPRDIPVGLDGEDAIAVPIEVGGIELVMTAVSMGNPHAVFFCEDVDSIELEKVGPLIENHEMFPNRVNAHFVQVLGPKELKIRTWERGTGITLACGTGACACCVASALNGLTGRSVNGQLPLGELALNWSEEDNCVYMSGPAAVVFEGIWPY